jgi:hypothetical protein
MKMEKNATVIYKILQQVHRNEKLTEYRSFCMGEARSTQTGRRYT